MRHLRHPLLLRLWAAGLLASLGLGLAAPAAAGRPMGAAGWDALDAIPQAAVERALAAAADAETPEALAEALARSLRAALGDAAPPAEALLHVVYGQLFRVLQEEVGSCAVVVASASGVALPDAAAGVRQPSGAPDGGPALGPQQEGPEQGRPAPRTLWPSVQPLGP